MCLILLESLEPTLSESVNNSKCLGGDLSLLFLWLVTILGGSRHLLMLTKAHQKTVQYGMVIAKRNILTQWKSGEAPSFKAWLSELTSLLHMERIRYNVSLSSATFDKMWQPFLLYLSRMS